MPAPPDDLRPQVYTDPRPAESMAPFHEWARTHEPGWTYPATRIAVSPLVLALYRVKPLHRENVPASGPVILAPNHFSNMDHFFAGVWLKRQIRFMTKSQFFQARSPLSWLFKTAGHFPVRRGTADEEAFVTAYSILGRGGCVGMYAEGGRSRTGELGQPRRGIGRLALESGVPVVPVAIQGSLDVRGWKRGRFPRVTVAYGEPLRFGQEPSPNKDRQAEIAELIFDQVRVLYSELLAAAAG